MSVTLIGKLPKKYATKVVIHRKSASSGLKKAIGGVVSYCVHGPTGKLSFPSSKMVEVLRVGLPVYELDALQASLAVPMEKLVPMLGISKATLHRRKAEGRLDQAESDRVVRFAKLMGKAVEVMESEENARQWLNSPQFGLGGAVPLEYAETEVGAREVENLLGRIEYGVYS
jgi:putative toxin-antitoxin system antitoxin component (TIGR02293 family)